MIIIILVDLRSFRDAKNFDLNKKSFQTRRK